ncbi:MAG: hypothetical protein ACI4RL_02670, partial [Ruminococcus sp.]
MKIIKKALAVALSATMAVSAFAVGGISASATDNSVQKTTSESLLERYKKQDNQSTDKKNYVEGEAVVMLKDTGLVSTGAGLEESIGVSGDIQVDSV